MKSYLINLPFIVTANGITKNFSPEQVTISTADIALQNAIEATPATLLGEMPWTILPIS